MKKKYVPKPLTMYVSVKNWDGTFMAFETYEDAFEAGVINGYVPPIYKVKITFLKRGR